jgi:hypothetical protein
MKSFIIFSIISFFICVHGVAWGIYEFQSVSGWETRRTLAAMKSRLITGLSEALAKRPARREKPPPRQPVKKPDAAKPQDLPALPEARAITPALPAAITPVQPAPITPVEPAPLELRRPMRNPKIAVLKIKTEADIYVEEANGHYDAGVVHLQNTFDKDETFDRENELAIEKFKQALAKYREAEQIDPDSLWLRNRIKDTNSNLVTCRRQAGRK